ncbi:hypothetical protein [Streptomyces sp. URMC 129]|uniref:hypothetical protein n=1 Tax=Streptomyces sp. URMC 129 TaxID=3423407 RepID=UPI003F1D9871
MTDSANSHTAAEDTDRAARRDMLLVLLSRGERGVLSRTEATALRAHVMSECDENDANRARARGAVAERARLREQLAAAEKQGGEATAAALRLHAQTPTAARATLDRIRQARTWADVWTHLGMYYGLKPEQAGIEARARRTEAEREAARKGRAEAEDALRELPEHLRKSAHAAQRAELRIQRAERRAAAVIGEARRWKAECIDRDRDGARTRAALARALALDPEATWDELTEHAHQIRERVAEYADWIANAERQDAEYRRGLARVLGLAPRGAGNPHTWRNLIDITADRHSLARDAKAEWDHADAARDRASRDADQLNDRLREHEADFARAASYLNGARDASGADNWPDIPAAIERLAAEAARYRSAWLSARRRAASPASGLLRDLVEQHRPQTMPDPHSAMHMAWCRVCDGGVRRLYLPGQEPAPACGVWQRARALNLIIHPDPTRATAEG